MRGLASGLAVFACISVAKAHPYASQLTNTSGTISFVLNEAATTVTVTLTNNGTGQGTTISTGTSKGVQTFSLTQGATTYANYAISVYKVGTGQITEISDDTNPLNSFGSKGNAVAVNTNAADSNFGRTYVGERLGGGFFVRNADQSDALGQGATALTAGLGTYLNAGGSSFDTARLFVGPDDTVYVGAGTTLANGCWLAGMTPDLSSYQFVLNGTDPTIPAGQNHGGVIGTPVVTGSLAAGNLVVTAMDWEYPPGDSLFQWNIGAGPFPSSVTPTLLASSTQGAFQNVEDGFIAPNGLWMYTFLSRGSHTTPGTQGSLQAFTVAGGNNIMWQSFANSITPGYDYLANCSDCWISPDCKFLVLIDDATSELMFCSLDQNTGIPIETTLFTNVVGTAIGSSYGQVCFDAAQNIYEMANGNGLLKVFSQGLTTMAVTANDSTTTHGTFNLSFPFPAISTSASIPVASQNTSPNGTGAGPAIPGQFTITRSGILTAPLTVFFTLGGTATNAQYTATAGASTFHSTNGSGSLITNSITIAAGQTTTNITITPVIDLVPRPLTTVALSIVTNVNYSVAVGGAAIVSIVNTGPQAVMVSGVQYPTMYKGLTNDFASFFITRLGDTNAPSYTINNFTYSGTATHGTDYTSVGRTVTNGTPAGVPLAIGGGVAINQGDITVSATISPLQNVTGYVGNKTATVGIAAGTGYTVAAGSPTATMTIIDNAYPTTPVLFADPLTAATNNSGNDGSATWAITFANTNSPVVPDYTAAFGYVLANDGVGNSPSGATTALKVTVNKSGNAASAGVNCYPIGLNFSGNYAARFSMLLLEDEGINNATEFAIFGINHSGTQTNWFAQDLVSSNGYTYPAAIDGVWYAIDAAAGGSTAGDYWELTGSSLASWGYVPLAVAGAGVGGTQNIGALFYNSFTNAFKNIYDNIPGPYTTYSGVGSVYDSAGDISDYISLNIPEANTWADVEIKQINNVVTMSINKTQIYSYTNTTLYANGTVDGTAYGSGPAHIPQSGTVMLGYVDPFGSVGDVGAAYFSNLKVVRIGPLVINSIALTGGNVVLTFTSEDGDDTTSSFSVLSSGPGGSAANVDTAVTGVTFAQVPGSLTFTATFPQPAAKAAYYRIKHN